MFWRGRNFCLAPDATRPDGMSCRNWFTGFGAERFEPRMTRIYTDKAEEQGRAWTSQAGAEFSNPFTSKLARNCENTSLSRSASGPAFSRFARDDWDGEREEHRVALGSPSGEMFWESIRRLACECLFKTAPPFAQRIKPGFSGKKTGSAISVLIREIRG